MIQLQDVNKYFFKGEERQVHALKNISLSIEEGEFTLFSGASGCGKTTLLNAVGALDDIDSGKILIGSHEISAMDEQERTNVRLTQMGFVFQAYNLVPVLSVEENIGFIMKLRGFSDAEIAKRVLEVSEMLEIDTKLKALPSTLSGGQQQRVAVARAVAAKPKVILADEPTANLDSKNSQTLMDMMRELNKKENITVIFASHDELVVESVDRVIYLHDGALVDA